MFIVIVLRGENRALIGGGGGGGGGVNICIFVFIPTNFFWNQLLEINREEHEYMNIQPAPPAPRN